MTFTKTLFTCFVLVSCQWRQCIVITSWGMHIVGTCILFANPPLRVDPTKIFNGFIIVFLIVRSSQGLAQNWSFHQTTTKPSRNFWCCWCWCCQRLVFLDLTWAAGTFLRIWHNWYVQLQHKLSFSFLQVSLCSRYSKQNLTV